MYKSDEENRREKIEKAGWLIVDTPHDKSCETEAEKEHGEKSNNQPGEVDPSLVSEIVEKLGPLSAEETEKLLEWLKLGSRCIKIRLAGTVG